MNDGAKVLVVMMTLAIPIIIVLSKSQIGSAIADAIRHNSGANEGAGVRRELEQMRAEIEQLRADVEDVHTQLLESHERLDFAERMLAQRSQPVPLARADTPV